MKLLNSNTLLILSALLLTSTFIYGCDEDDYYMADLSTVPDPYEDTKTPIETIEQENGLVIHIYEEGDGDFTVSDRDDVLVRYTGRLSNGDIFDSSWVDGNTAARNFNVQGVVRGFSEGLIGMREGTVMTLVIPAELGYGPQGRGGGPGFSEIPANSTLVFDIELVQVID
ncbi:MAG: FKBP-type peptidyl-prolyl cis-trans isomerase [Balneolales bacterium]